MFGETAKLHSMSVLRSPESTVPMDHPRGRVQTLADAALKVVADFRPDVRRRRAGFRTAGAADEPSLLMVFAFATCVHRCSCRRLPRHDHGRASGCASFV